MASVIASQIGGEIGLQLKLISAAIPCGNVSVGTIYTSFPVRFTTWRALKITLLLFGSRIMCCALTELTAASSSSVLGIHRLPT